MYTFDLGYHKTNHYRRCVLEDIIIKTELLKSVMEINDRFRRVKIETMEFVRCPSQFYPLTVGLSLVTNTKYSVFLSICLIPAKRISGSFFKYIALLVLLHLSIKVVLIMLHYTQYGSTSESEVVKQLRKLHFKYPQIVLNGLYICCSYFGEKGLSG
jgi:hypothetical protein